MAATATGQTMTENIDSCENSSKRRKLEGKPFVEPTPSSVRDEWVVRLQKVAALAALSTLPMADDKAHVLLGSGQFAQVFAYRISRDIWLAYKKTRLAKLEENDADSRLEVTIEGRIMSFLTATYLQPILLNKATAAAAEAAAALGTWKPLACPNFVAVLRHDFGRNVVRFIDDEAEYRRNDIAASSMWLERCESQNFHEYYAKPRNCAESLRTSLAVSVIGQMLMAILCCGGVGLFHNDMRMTNWLLRSYNTPTAGLLYCIPGVGGVGAEDVYVRLPGAEGIPLLAVADFGLGSVDGWRADPRMSGFENCSEPVAMMCNYYTLKERNTSDLTRLSLTSTGDSLGHYRPLSFGKLERHQRDMATVLSFFEAVDESMSGHAAIAEFQRLAGAAIDALTAVRPKSYAEQRAVLLKMLVDIPEFAACVVAKPPAESQETVNRLPSDEQSRVLSALLLDRVSAPVKCRNEFKLSII